MESSRGQGALGPFMSLSLVIGTMVGAGIFFLPSLLAPLGWNAVIGWLVAGAGALCLAASFRFLMDSTGQGIQHNVERVLGEVPGFLTVWAYWVAGFTSVAALTLAGGSIIAGLLFDDPKPYVSVIAALVLLWLVVAINLSGTRSAGRMQVATVIIKLIPLVLVIGAFAWVAFGPRPLQPMAPAPVTFDNITGAVALTLFALIGFEAASIPVNKIKNPGRNIPIALLGGTLFVVTIYLFASAGMVMILPWEEIAASSTPFSDALRLILGPVAGVIVSICILVSVTGCSNGTVLVGADCTYSMALRGEVPRFLAQTNSRGVPHWGVILPAIIASILILANLSRGLSGMFAFMVLLTSGGVLVFYFLAGMAAAKENRKVSRWPVLLLGLAFTGLATYGTGIESSAWVIVLLAIGLIVRWFCKRSSVTDAAAEPAV